MHQQLQYPKSVSRWERDAQRSGGIADVYSLRRRPYDRSHAYDPRQTPESHTAAPGPGERGLGIPTVRLTTTVSRMVVLVRGERELERAVMILGMMTSLSACVACPRRPVHRNSATPAVRLAVSQCSSGASRPEVGWLAGEDELPITMPPSRGCLHMYHVHPQDPGIQNMYARCTRPGWDIAGGVAADLKIPVDIGVHRSIGVEGSIARAQHGRGSLEPGQILHLKASMPTCSQRLFFRLGETTAYGWPRTIWNSTRTSYSFVHIRTENYPNQKQIHTIQTPELFARPAINHEVAEELV